MTIGSSNLIVNALSIVGPVLLILPPVFTIRSILHAPTRPVQGIVVPLISAMFFAALFNYLPPLIEDVINHAHLPVDEVYYRYAEEIPKQLEVADLHCDALLWGSRDLMKTKMHPFIADRVIGSVDLPRLQAGNVKLQVFAAVNSAVRKMNFNNNRAPSKIADTMVLKTFFERWPSRTWFSPKERVLYQFHRLKDLSKRSQGQIEIIRSRDNLEQSTASVRAIFAVEGLSCLGSDVKTVDEFYNVGIRVLGPTHFFDTEVGGSQSGACNCGLSEFGRRVIQRMKDLNMIVDLAHASVPLMEDILNLEDDKRPALMISHTGLKSVCSGNRNLADDMMLRISKAGGLIGIALFEPAQCGGDIIGSFVKSVIHADKVLGTVDFIALGSDWDGMVATAVSAADTHLLTAALQIGGNFTEAAVRRMMHDNANDFFKRNLPE